MEDQDKVYQPGEIIRGLLQERGWTHADLADRIQKYRPDVSALISGSKNITPEIALALSVVLGQSAEYWLGLQARYDLSLLCTEKAAATYRRTRIYDFAPIKDMEKRNWIKPSKSIEETEREIMRFFRISSLDEEPKIPVAMRKSDALSSLNTVQRAWCFRASELAQKLSVKAFDKKKLDDLAKSLRQLAAYKTAAGNLASTLMDHGIRFVVVEPIAGCQIDGAAFWLDETSPVIAVSLRHDRIDSFWFTVMHEFEHIRAGDTGSVDTDLTGDDYRPSRMKEESERKADEGAAAMLVPPLELDSFIRRVGPLYSKEKIIQFAHRIKMHPGIIVGQLQHAAEIGYGSNREMLVKIRDVVTSTALTDGYGSSILFG